MHGGVTREERRRIMAEFRAGAYNFVLANRVASEGLDFEFCSAVINYDLPWNPMEIEQRIGRIDRIGQKEETILVVNFVNDSTIDERILTRLLDRIQSSSPRSVRSNRSSRLMRRRSCRPDSTSH